MLSLQNVVFLVASILYIYSKREDETIRNTTLCQLHKVSKGVFGLRERAAMLDDKISEFTRKKD